MDDQETATRKLMLMVKSGNVSDISELLRQSPGIINGTDKNGNTALILASYYGNEMLVRLLVARGANTSIKNDRGYDALHIVKHERDMAMDEPKDSVSGSRLVRYEKIFAMLYDTSNSEQLKDLARRDSALSETKVYLFPSLHPDVTEAPQLRAWIRKQKREGVKLVVMFEYGSQARETFGNLDDPAQFDFIMKRVNKKFRPAVKKMLEVFRDEKLPLYPVDTRFSEYKKETIRYMGQDLGERIERVITGSGDVDELVREV